MSKKLKGLGRALNTAIKIFPKAVSDELLATQQTDAVTFHYLMEEMGLFEALIKYETVDKEAQEALKMIANSNGGDKEAIENFILNCISYEPPPLSQPQQPKQAQEQPKQAQEQQPQQSTPNNRLDALRAERERIKASVKNEIKAHTYEMENVTGIASRELALIEKNKDIAKVCRDVENTTNRIGNMRDISLAKADAIFKGKKSMLANLKKEMTIARTANDKKYQAVIRKELDELMDDIILANKIYDEYKGFLYTITKNIKLMFASKKLSIDTEKELLTKLGL